MNNFDLPNLLQAGRFNYTPRGDIQLPKVREMENGTTKNTNALTEKELDKLKKNSSKLMMTFLQQGGTMATYWLVGRKEEERDV